MKNLKTLIKLRKHSINEILKRISLLQQHKVVLEERLMKLVWEMSNETEKFGGTEYGFVLDSYLKGAREQKTIYIKGVITTESKIQQSKFMLHDEFGEMKKLEIALQNREKQMELDETMKEAKSIDDMSLMRRVRQST